MWASNNWVQALSTEWVQHRACQVSQEHGRLWLGSHYCIQQTCKGCQSSGMASNDLSEDPDEWGRVALLPALWALLGQGRAVCWVNSSSSNPGSLLDLCGQAPSSLCAGLGLDASQMLTFIYIAGILLQGRFRFSRSGVGLMIPHY